MAQITTQHPRRNEMKYFLVGLLFLGALNSYAEISVNIQGASNVIYPQGRKVPNMYYSNIYKLDSTGQFWIGIQGD